MTDEIKKRNENRLVVCVNGKKLCENWNVEITESIQDKGKTLKIFAQEKQRNI